VVVAGLFWVSAQKVLPSGYELPFGLLGDVVINLFAGTMMRNKWKSWVQQSTGVSLFAYKSRAGTAAPAATDKDRMKSFLQTNCGPFMASLVLRMPGCKDQRARGSLGLSVGGYLSTALRGWGMSKAGCGVMQTLLQGRNYVSGCTDNTSKVAAKRKKACIAEVRAKEDEVEKKWWTVYHFDNFAPVYYQKKFTLRPSEVHARKECSWTGYGKMFTRVPAICMSLGDNPDPVWPPGQDFSISQMTAAINSLQVRLFACITFCAESKSV